MAEYYLYHAFSDVDHCFSNHPLVAAVQIITEDPINKANQTKQHYKSAGTTYLLRVERDCYPVPLGGTHNGHSLARN
jgi:hypothetical protein